MSVLAKVMDLYLDYRGEVGAYPTYLVICEADWFSLRREMRVCMEATIMDRAWWDGEVLGMKVITCPFQDVLYVKGDYE
jgi:hypothetical protein